MNALVSKLSSVVMEKSGMKMFRQERDSSKEELFLRDIQSCYRVAKSLMIKVDEVESGDRKLVLVADDELLTFELVEEFLCEAEINCDMITAVSGEKAYDLASSLIPDLIITDWLMPEMDGPELIKKLKDNPDTKQIPIILITGLLPSSVELSEVLEAGATDYLRKPLDFTELKARVKTALALGESGKEVRRLGESIALRNLMMRFMLGNLSSPAFCVDGRGYFAGCNVGFETFVRKAAPDMEGHLAARCLPAPLANILSCVLVEEKSEEIFELIMPNTSMGGQAGLYTATFKVLASGSERLIICQITGERI